MGLTEAGEGADASIGSSPQDLVHALLLKGRSLGGVLSWPGCGLVATSAVSPSCCMCLTSFRLLCTAGIWSVSPESAKTSLGRWRSYDMCRYIKVCEVPSLARYICVRHASNSGGTRPGVAAWEVDADHKQESRERMRQRLTCGFKLVVLCQQGRNNLKQVVHVNRVLRYHPLA